MNTHETLLLKTLQAKQLHKNGGDTARFIDAVLDQNPEEAERLTKNVCARIPLALAEEMEGFGSLLDLNKREIITMALRDFLDKVKSLVDEYDAWPLPDDGEE